MDIIAICGLAVVAVVSALVVKKHNPETALIISISAGILILLAVFGKISPISDEIRALLQNTNISSDYVTILLKTLGICFICQFTADSCKDAGESAIASKVEFAGRVAILVIALPLFENITRTATSLIGG